MYSCVSYKTNPFTQLVWLLYSGVDSKWEISKRILYHVHDEFWIEKPVEQLVHADMIENVTML
jgi:hypothetical protein